MKKENDSFLVFDNSLSGLLFDDSNHKNFPIRYYNVIGTMPFYNEDSSYYVYVYQGKFILDKDYMPLALLKDGMYCSLSGGFTLICNSENSKAIVIEVLHNKGIYPKNNYSAMYNIGGTIESKGRLKYIDGCSDTLLISPVKLGDPCLNHLHFPSNIDQTQHTHPSHRIGVVASGYGECITPFGNTKLEKGMIFIIKEWDGESYSNGLDGNVYPLGQHAFKTFDSNMDVIAFHPDSDFGPTDETHPMINRTIVNGESANKIKEILTKTII